MLNKVLKKVFHMEKTKQVQQHTPSLLEMYEATMVLAAVGDAMGYANGHWQFNHSGSRIHQQMMKFTNNKGVSNLRIEPIGFRYSDDTVMHFATAEALVHSLPYQDQSSICLKLASEYQKCWEQMGGRAPGNTCRKGIFRLNKDCSNWNSNPFSPNAAGCGGAMRSACIGLFYPRVQDIERLISISIESGRITHHNPIGYLGSMVASYFTALAIRSIPPNEWLSLLMTQAFPLSQDYISKSKISVADNLHGGDWQKCVNKWKRYAKSRKMDLNKPSQPYFPSEYGVEEREKFYLEVSNGAWPGGLGIDSVIIAYDGLLGCGGNWDELCLRAMLHGGDNDSTGTIAGAWFGALYGFKGVSKLNMDEVQGKEKAINYGKRLFNIAFKPQNKSTESTQ